MKNQISIRPFKESDISEIQAIFNYYARESFAVYTDKKFTRSFVQKRIRQASIFMVAEIGKQVIGFGYISPYNPFQTFAHTGVLTYFLSALHTGNGLGSRLLNRLFEKGRAMGITHYLAHIASPNEMSLKFHHKHGFQKVGQFKDVVKKFNQSMDVVWVQKIID